MAIRLLLGLIACFMIGSCMRSDAPEGLRILFVGNSLTYVGNLPAVLGALSLANDQPTQSDMLVAAGGTLTDRLRDGSVGRAIAKRDYDVVVLQERGGDFACGFGPQVCADARASLSALVDLVRGAQAKP